MNYIKAFIAGLAFPATIFPFLFLGLYAINPQIIHTLPLAFIPLFIPIVFGVWNVVYFIIGDRCAIKQLSLRLWFTGIVLGLFVALVGVFIIHLPTLLFGLTGFLFYMPLIIIPIIYGLIWRYIVYFLNTMVGLES